jgi:hypothetical protein
MPRLGIPGDVAARGITFPGHNRVRVDHLAGSLRHSPGIIALVALARERGLETVYVPAIDAREATLLGGVRVMPVPMLAALVRHLPGEAPWISHLQAYHQPTPAGRGEAHSPEGRYSLPPSRGFGAQDPTLYWASPSHLGEARTEAYHGYLGRR